MSRRLRTVTGHESGYTLIELLTVVSIVAVLASIAVPFFLGQREAAWRSAAANDARNTAIVVESVAVDHGLPDRIDNTGSGIMVLADATPDVPLAIGARSSGIRLEYHRAEETPRYCVCAYHEGLGEAPAAVFDSGAGGLVDQCGIESEAALCTGLPQLVIAAGVPVSFNVPEWWPRPLVDAPLVTEGTLRLDGVQATHGHDTLGGGWGLAYGEFVGHSGRDLRGYTVQFDRHLDAFLVTAWRLGAEYPDANDQPGRDRDLEVARIRRDQIPALQDDGDWWSARHDVELDVADGSLHLRVDGEAILSYEMAAGVQGTFGSRAWAETTVAYDDARLLVD